MTYAQKRNWGYDEDGVWGSVVGRELPEGWTHDDPNKPEDEAVSPPEGVVIPTDASAPETEHQAAEPEG